MAATKIEVTKDYRKFVRSDDNRPTNPEKHKALRRSMEKYGFLPCFPIIVRRIRGRLVIVDGQHRAQIAETLGLPIWWVETEADFDIAEINTTAEKWRVTDYAEKFAQAGNRAYVEALEFTKDQGLPISMAAALLSGSASYSNCRRAFQDGEFKIKDRAWAEAVATIYAQLVRMQPRLRNRRFVEACMAVGRVPSFDAKRLIAGARHCPERLQPFANRDAYLEMLEHLYNYKRGASSLVALKMEATKVMRERNAATAKAKAKAAKVKTKAAKVKTKAGRPDTTDGRRPEVGA